MTSSAKAARKSFGAIEAKSEPLGLKDTDLIKAFYDHFLTGDKPNTSFQHNKIVVKYFVKFFTSQQLVGGDSVMRYYIGIQDLAANALIELLDKNCSRRVTLRALTEYGVAVVSALNKEKDEAVLLLSRDRTLGFIKECSDLFDVEGFDTSDAAIVLKEDFTSDDLIERFCGSISISVLKALSDCEAIRVLFEAA